MSDTEIDAYLRATKYLLFHLSQLIDAVEGPHWEKRFLNFQPIDAGGDQIQVEGPHYHFTPFAIPVVSRLADLCRVEMQPIHVLGRKCWTAGEAVQRLYEQLTDYVPRTDAQPESLAQSKRNLQREIVQGQLRQLVELLKERVEMEAARARLSSGEPGDAMRGEKIRTDATRGLVPNQSNGGITTILFISADPSNQARLRLDQEIRDIQDTLSRAKLRDSFKFEVRVSLRPSDITQAIFDTDPQMVHFSGHATSSGDLCFEDKNGATQTVSSIALAELFRLLRQVKCVILNACYTKENAQAIARHIPFVVGMSQPIGDKAAIAFATGFYRAIATGYEVPKAFEFGVVELRLLSIPEHLTPTLVSSSPEGNRQPAVESKTQQKLGESEIGQQYAVKILLSLASYRRQLSELGKLYADNIGYCADVGMGNLSTFDAEGYPHCVLNLRGKANEIWFEQILPCIDPVVTWLESHRIDSTKLLELKRDFCPAQADVSKFNVLLQQTADQLGKAIDTVTVLTDRATLIHRANTHHVQGPAGS